MTTPAKTQLDNFLSSDQGQAAYIDWISHPITQMVLAASRELSRPRFPIDRSDCTLAFGECLGANNLLDFITSPTGNAANRMRGTLPPARYGVPASPDKGE